MRWRPLEAALALVGSQAGDIQDCVEEELEGRRPKPFDIETLLTKVIPPILHLSSNLNIWGSRHVLMRQFQTILSSRDEALSLLANLQARFRHN
jgi:importin-9